MQREKLKFLAQCKSTSMTVSCVLSFDIGGKGFRLGAHGTCAFQVYIDICYSAQWLPDIRLKLVRREHSPSHEANYSKYRRGIRGSSRYQIGKMPLQHAAVHTCFSVSTQ